MDNEKFTGRKDDPKTTEDVESQEPDCAPVQRVVVPHRSWEAICRWSRIYRVATEYKNWKGSLSLWDILSIAQISWTNRLCRRFNLVREPTGEFAIPLG